jgi:hypothetical protein
LSIKSFNSSSVSSGSGAGGAAPEAADKISKSAAGKR